MTSYVTSAIVAVVVSIAALLGLKQFKRRVSLRKLTADANRTATDRVADNAAARADATDVVDEARLAATEEI